LTASTSWPKDMSIHLTESQTSGSSSTTRIRFAEAAVAACSDSLPIKSEASAVKPVPGQHERSVRGKAIQNFRSGRYQPKACFVLVLVLVLVLDFSTSSLGAGVSRTRTTTRTIPVIPNVGLHKRHHSCINLSHA